MGVFDFFKSGSESSNQDSDFERFKDFIKRWNTSMPRDEKLKIAQVSDDLNNIGTILYNSGNVEEAIDPYEKALFYMPNNDDALENLKNCYEYLGQHSKARALEKKLIYLSQQ